MFRTASSLMALLCTVAPLMADDSAKPPAVPGKVSQPADDSEIAKTVDLLDGADSAEDAVKAFVAASAAADDEAALLMVDPPIRRLLIPEIAIEQTAIDSAVIEYAFFGKPKGPVGGMLFYFAQRDLINIQDVKIIETRVVDDNHVVFTVLTTELSYHGAGKTKGVQEILAVRRSDRWFVFRLFGMLTHYFRGEDDFFGVGAGRMIDAKKGTRLDADFELRFIVPIEAMHAELVRCSESPAIAESLLIASRLRRFHNSIKNRAKRGEYKTRDELTQDFSRAASLQQELLSKIQQAVQPALENLAKTYSIKSKKADPD